MWVWSSYLGVSVGGLAVVVAGWLHYLALIPRERVPARPRLHLAAVALGAGAALTGAAAATRAAAPPPALVVVCAVVAAGLAGFFWWLLRQAKLPAGEPAAPSCGGSVTWRRPSSDAGSRWSP